MKNYKSLNQDFVRMKIWVMCSILIVVEIKPYGPYDEEDSGTTLQNNVIYQILISVQLNSQGADP